VQICYGSDSIYMGRTHDTIFVFHALNIVLKFWLLIVTGLLHSSFDFQPHPPTRYGPS
jgi:hypothetical protein